MTFQYTISDGQGGEATGKVTVTVLLEAVPGAPFARDDFGDTELGKPVTIDVLANDTDPSGGAPSLAGTPVCPSGGSATKTNDERVVLTPPATTGTFRCKYTVINQQGRSATASIIVNVTPATTANHPPTISVGPLQVNLGATLPVNANEIARDDDGDALVFTSVDNPALGTTQIGANPATFTYTPPPLGSVGTFPQNVTIRFTISDGRDGGNVSGVLSIRVVDPTVTTTPGVTPNPVTRDILKGAFVGDTPQVDVVKELRDNNLGTTLTLKDASYASGPGGVQSVSGPVVTMSTTGAGELVVNYTVTNAEGGTATGKIRVTVTNNIPANPPLAVSDQLQVASGGSGRVDLLANDQGIDDPGDKVQVSLVNRPPSSFGTVDLSPTGVLSFVATTDAPGGTAELTYTLGDGTGQTSSAKVTITLLPCGESSPAVRDASLFTPYQTPISIDLNDFVLAGSIRPGSSSGADLNGASSGVYTPPAGMNGTETITYIVENGCHQTVQGHVAIDVNHRPVGATVSQRSAERRCRPSSSASTIWHPTTSRCSSPR